MAPMDFTHTMSSPISTTAPRTQITTSTPSEDEHTPPPRIPDGTLRLRGGPIQDRRVTWGEDVIDNEELGRKKSKGATFISQMHKICFVEICFGDLDAGNF